MSKKISGSFDSSESDLVVDTWWTMHVHKKFSTLEVRRIVTEEGSGDHSSKTYRGTLAGNPFRFLRVYPRLGINMYEQMRMEKCAEDISFGTELLDWDEMENEVFEDVYEKVKAYSEGTE